MTNRYIITLTAANRVGILAAVTNALAELGGDLQEASQTVMQKFFTIILAIDFPEELDPQVIADHIHDIGRPYGIEVCLKIPARELAPDAAEIETKRYFLTVSGRDKPGIIRQVSARLAQEGIDVTDLYGIRDDDERAFVIAMELAVPATADVSSLQEGLEQLGRSVEVTIALQHEGRFESPNGLPNVRILAHRAQAAFRGGDSSR